MSSSGIFKEFLIRLGFDVDEQKYKNFESKVRTLTVDFEKYGKIATVAGGAVSAAILKTASDMEKLYFASEKAGTNVNSLMSLRFAAEQIGVGADAATAGIQNMASVLRSNPGLQIFFRQLGIKQVGDNTQNFINLISKLKAISAQGPFGHAIATQIAAQFGMSEQDLLLYEKNDSNLIRQQERFKGLAKLGGVDVDRLAEQSNKFMTDVRTLLATSELIGIAGFGKLLPEADELVLHLQAMAEWLLKINRETDGWATAITSVAATLTTVFGGLGLIKGTLGLAGGAGLGTAAVGTGLFGFDALLGAHVYGQAKQLYQAYDQSGDFQNIGGSISKLIARAEGFSSRIYRDIGGHATIGYGHEVQPGEDFSGGISKDQGFALLQSDISKAQAAIHRLVKVQLNSEQFAQLTDFVYNVGAGNFAKSTLLKDLNAGDFADASKEFAKWNKVAGQANAGLTNRRLGESAAFSAKPDVNFNQETNITVTSSDPKAAGQSVAAAQRTVNGNLIRNMSGVVQ